MKAAQVRGRMEEPMKDRLTLFTKYLLDVLFYAGIVVTVTLPFSIRFYGKYDSYFGQHWLRLTILFGISGYLPQCDKPCRENAAA